jgi:hypothetical protein
MWRVERRHEVAGLVVSDLLRWDEDLLEFPRTEAEFPARFADENLCREHLARL